MAMGISLMYFLTSFIGDIQDKDDRLKNKEYDASHLYDKYKKTDSIGQDILDVSYASRTEQIGAWNNSQLKDEFNEIFPAFDEMKFFIKDRIRGEILVPELTKTLTDIEDKFFSGGINAEEAKRQLGTLK